MKPQFNITGSLDLRGVSCPVNAVRAKQSIDAIGDDEMIELIVDEGQALVNVVRSINDAGYRIFKSKPLENSVAIIVGKRKTAG
ncbi:MAG TPA: sulfurtransferase TusA family protein [Chlorobaculum sp.]|nr:sulfurtransferase TusA family protein [Chlorobaculum sp.]